MKYHKSCGASEPTVPERRDLRRCPSPTASRSSIRHQPQHVATALWYCTISLNESSNAARAEIQTFGADCTHFALVSGNLHRVFDDLFAPRLRINGRTQTRLSAPPIGRMEKARSSVNWVTSNLRRGSLYRRACCRLRPSNARGQAHPL